MVARLAKSGIQKGDTAMKKRRKNNPGEYCCILGIIISGILVFQQSGGSEKQKRIIFISKTIDPENDFWVQVAAWMVRPWQLRRIVWSLQ